MRRHASRRHAGGVNSSSVPCARITRGLMRARVATRPSGYQMPQTTGPCALARRRNRQASSSRQGRPEVTRRSTILCDAFAFPPAGVSVSARGRGRMRSFDFCRDLGAPVARCRRGSEDSRKRTAAFGDAQRRSSRPGRKLDVGLVATRPCQTPLEDLCEVGHLPCGEVARAGVAIDGERSGTRPARKSASRRSCASVSPSRKTPSPAAFSWARASLGSGTRARTGFCSAMKSTIFAKLFRGCGCSAGPAPAPPPWRPG